MYMHMHKEFISNFIITGRHRYIVHYAPSLRDT